MTVLSLEKALELYNVLGKYLPDIHDVSNGLDFIEEIINNAIKDNSSAYISALSLMTEMSIEELAGFSSDYRLELFMDGITKNNIIQLADFCEKIGYGRNT